MRPWTVDWKMPGRAFATAVGWPAAGSCVIGAVSMTECPMYRDPCFSRPWGKWDWCGAGFTSGW